MTMHLVGPYLSTTVTSRKTKPSKSAKLAEAARKHAEWLAKQGLMPDQIKKKKEVVGNARIDLPDYSLDRSTIKLSNNLLATGGFKKGLMANLHKESPSVQKEIMDKASRCMPLYNKGGIQYATPGEDMTQVGSKSRRG